MAKDIFKRLAQGRLQQDKDAMEQWRRSANPISQWAQACIDTNRIYLDEGPFGLAKTFSLGTRILTGHLFKSCVAFCKHRGIRPPNKYAFGRACTKMFGPRQLLADKKRPHGYDVPKREIWQEILDGVRKQWRPQRPGDWINTPPRPTAY